MNQKEIIALSRDEVVEKIAEHKKQLLSLRVQKATSQLTKWHLLKQTRKTVARLNTRLSQIEKGLA